MTENDKNTLNRPGHVNHVKATNTHKTGIYSLKNENGTQVQISIEGNRLVNLFTKDMAGRFIDVVVVPQNVIGNSSYMKSDYAANADGPKIDLRHVVWDATQINENSIIFTYFSGDSEFGAAKNLEIKVTYKLTGDNGLKISYEATTDRPVAVQCNQPFFNLNGGGSVFNHYLQINADVYFTLDSSGISTGNAESVNGTPFDFEKATTIGARINDNSEQLTNGNGYNHTFVINKHSSRTPVARVKGEKSGIIMELCTEDTGLHFYCSKFNNRNNSLNDNACLPAGFGLTPRHFPDLEDNTPYFYMVLNPGEIYKSVCLYRFKIN